MKKTSIVIIVTLCIMLLLGTIYLGNSIYEKKYSKSNKGNSGVGDNILSQQSSTDITFGEYNCKISDNDMITVRYIKSGQSIRIFSLHPVPNEANYDIMTNGNMAAYLSKDGHIWSIDSSGSYKKLTPDKYENVVKADVQKANPGYIWAQEPRFTADGSVVFSSNLPENNKSGGNIRKTLWKINLENGNMKTLYTPLTDSYKLLGVREDGNYMVLDGDNIAIVDQEGKIKNMNMADKYILNLSPDGRRMVYVRRDMGTKQPDYKNIYMMDSYGKNSERVPDIEGFTPTGICTWNDDSTTLAFIVKNKSDGKNKIAVASFEEDFLGVSTPSLSDGVKIPENCKIQWSDDNTVSIDTGDDVLSVNINQ